MSLRIRVAAVVALACIACALVMGLLGLRITRTRIVEVAGGASIDVVSMLAAELEEQGITPDRFATDPSLEARASDALAAALSRLNKVGSVWTNATILQPVGDRWRMLAIATTLGAEHRLHGPGDVIEIRTDDPSQSLSIDHASAGWFSTDFNEWFGASVPLGGSSGIVTMAMHNDDANAYLRQVLELALKALGIATVVGLALGWWSSAVIVRPIEVVRSFAARLGRRELGTRVEVRGAPEMRRLLSDMNRLAEDLSQSELRLHERTVRMAEMRDPKETGPHVKRVSDVSLEIFEGWLARHPMEEADADLARHRLRSAAVLHDVGKVAIEDAVLKKPGKLDEAEYANMKHHSVIAAGAVLTGDDAQDRAAREVALHHHERWDGTGYPGRADVLSADGDLQRLRALPIPAAGLAGEEIPLFARIVSIADVFDALSSRRSYKDPWPEAKVLQTIRDESGKAFDPELVEIFVERFDRVKAAWARHPDQAHGA